MGIVIRKSLTTTVFSYLGVVIGYLNILFFFPKFLSTEQIGLYRLVLDCAILLAPFAQSGVMQGVVKFYPTFTVESKRREFILFTLLFSLISAGIFALIMILLKSEILYLLNHLFTNDTREVSRYYDLLLYLILVLSFIALYEGFARANLGVVLVNLLKDVYIRLLTAISVFVYFRQLITFEGLIYSLLIIYGSAAVILFIHTTFSYKIFATPHISKIRFREMTDFIRYSLFMVLSAGSNMVIGKIDSIMVGAFLGLSSNGIYTTLFFVAVVIEMPKRAIVQIMIPLYAKAFAADKMDEVRNLYAKSALNQLIIGLLLYIGIVVNLHNLFFFIPNGDEFATGKWVVVIIGASKVTDMAAGANGELIIMSRHFRFNIYLVAILAVLTFGTNMLFIPNFGLEGAAIATLISIFVLNLVKLIFIYKKFRFQPFEFNTLKILAIGAVAFLAGIFLPELSNHFLDIFIRSAVVTLIFGLLIISTKVSSDINNFLTDSIKRIKR